MCAVPGDVVAAAKSETATGDAEAASDSKTNLKRVGGDAAALSSGNPGKKHKSLRRQEKEREYYMRQERLKATRKAAPCRHFATHGKCAHGDACQFTHVRPGSS